jgi:hypothetical protein
MHLVPGSTSLVVTPGVTNHFFDEKGNVEKKRYLEYFMSLIIKRVLKSYHSDLANGKEWNAGRC